MDNLHFDFEDDAEVILSFESLSEEAIKKLNGFNLKKGRIK